MIFSLALKIVQGVYSFSELSNYTLHDYLIMKDRARLSIKEPHKHPSYQVEIAKIRSYPPLVRNMETSELDYRQHMSLFMLQPPLSIDLDSGRGPPAVCKLVVDIDALERHKVSH